MTDKTRLEVQPQRSAGANMNNELIERIDEEIGDLAKVVVPPEHIRLLQDCKAVLTQQQEAEPVDDEEMFEWIYGQANRSLRRHRSTAKGIQGTRADNSNTHLIWAALQWAELHPPKPAAHRAMRGAEE